MNRKHAWRDTARIPRLFGLDARILLLLLLPVIVPVAKLPLLLVCSVIGTGFVIAEQWFGLTPDAALRRLRFRLAGRPPTRFAGTPAAKVPLDRRRGSIMTPTLEHPRRTRLLAGGTLLVLLLTGPVSGPADAGFRYRPALNGPPLTAAPAGMPAAGSDSGIAPVAGNCGYSSAAVLAAPPAGAAHGPPGANTGCAAANRLPPPLPAGAGLTMSSSLRRRTGRSGALVPITASWLPVSRQHSHRSGKASYRTGRRQTCTTTRPTGSSS